MGETRDDTIHELGARVREDLAQLREAAQRKSSELWREWRDLVQRQPEVAVAVAFGVGLVLSGALVSRVTLRVASVAARLYARRLISEAARGLTGELGEFLGGLSATQPAGAV